MLLTKAIFEPKGSTWVIEERERVRRMALLDIALHLSDYVRYVTCVESYAESAVLGARNIAANGVANATMDSADVLPFLREQAPGAFDGVVADPPHAGMWPEV